MPTADQLLTEALARAAEVKPGPTASSQRALASTKDLIRRARSVVTPPPLPPVEPPPVEPPPPRTFRIGIDAGTWGAAGAKDVKAITGFVRYDTERGAAGVGEYKAAGCKIQLLFPGPYNAGGVKALDQTKWVANALAFYKANVTPAICPAIEVLNEPGGTWFWGSGAVSAANGEAYRNLLKATYAAFHAEYGVNAPLILGTVDGAGGLAFGRTWVTPDWVTYVDGFVVHPYGGTGSRASSALGNRGLIQDAHALTNGPIYCTEIGWPTAQGQPATGDSLQWSQGEQAANITSFADWCNQPEQDYVREFIYFQYRDYGTNMWYGVQSAGGSVKQSQAALSAAAKKYSTI